MFFARDLDREHRFESVAEISFSAQVIWRPKPMVRAARGTTIERIRAPMGKS
jgi:hypothetical protein